MHAWFKGYIHVKDMSQKIDLSISKMPRVNKGHITIENYLSKYL